MPKIAVRRGLAAISALIGAATLSAVAAQPAQAQPWDRSCDSYQSRNYRGDFLRIPSRSDGGLDCRLHEGDDGPGVRVLKISLRLCYGFDIYGDDFDNYTERALRRVQRRIGDDGPEGVYTRRTIRAGFEYAIYENSWGWDTTGQCDSWR